jgi:hypothetical protein
MEFAIQLISDLIEHLKQEEQDKTNQCFYCGGLHKTADCCSQKRHKFIRHLLEMQSLSQNSNSEFDKFANENFSSKENCISTGHKLCQKLILQ